MADAEVPLPETDGDREGVEAEVVAHDGTVVSERQSHEESGLTSEDVDESEAVISQQALVSVNKPSASKSGDAEASVLQAIDPADLTEEAQQKRGCNEQPSVLPDTISASPADQGSEPALAPGQTDGNPVETASTPQAENPADERHDVTIPNASDSVPAQIDGSSEARGITRDDGVDQGSGHVLTENEGEIEEECVSEADTERNDAVTAAAAGRDARVVRKEDMQRSATAAELRCTEIVDESASAAEPMEASVEESVAEEEATQAEGGGEAGEVRQLLWDAATKHSSEHGLLCSPGSIMPPRRKDSAGDAPTKTATAATAPAAAATGEAGGVGMAASLAVTPRRSYSVAPPAAAPMQEPSDDQALALALKMQVEQQEKRLASLRADAAAAAAAAAALAESKRRQAATKHSVVQSHERLTALTTERKSKAKKLERAVQQRERARARGGGATDGFDGDDAGAQELLELAKRLKEENARLELALPPPGEARYQLEKVNNERRDLLRQTRETRRELADMEQQIEFKRQEVEDYKAALAPSPAVQGGAKKAARLKASVATLTSARVDADRNVVALSANRTRAIAALDPFLKSLSAAARHKLKHANAAKANADDPRNDAWPSLKEVGRQELKLLLDRCMRMRKAELADDLGSGDAISPVKSAVGASDVDGLLAHALCDYVSVAAAETQRMQRAIADAESAAKKCETEVEACTVQLRRLVEARGKELKIRYPVHDIVQPIKRAPRPRLVIKQSQHTFFTELDANDDPAVGGAEAYFGSKPKDGAGMYVPEWGDDAIAEGGSRSEPAAAAAAAEAATEAENDSTAQATAEAAAEPALSSIDALRAKMMEMAGQIVDLLKGWDAAGSGVATEDELRKALLALGLEASDADMHTLFESLDVTGDDTFDVAELPTLLRVNAPETLLRSMQQAKFEQALAGMRAEEPGAPKTAKTAEAAEEKAADMVEAFDTATPAETSAATAASVQQDAAAPAVPAVACESSGAAAAEARMVDVDEQASGGPAPDVSPDK